VRKVTRIDGNNALQAFKPKVRVAAYCRVSTDSDEQMASLEAQKDHYESYIRANPDWEFAGIYYDEGISGTKKENRTGLLRLLADCENKKIDFIITKSVSRFARNTTDCIEIVRKLTDLGVFIYFEKENINTQRIKLMFKHLHSKCLPYFSIFQLFRWSVTSMVFSRTSMAFPSFTTK
jgi:site-specific DNA recombinase